MEQGLYATCPPQLPEEIEKKIIEVLLKEVMPTLSEIEGAALKRFVS